MTSITRSTLRLAATVLAVCAMTFPASALAQDLRSPDARDAAAGLYLGSPAAQDLRSPDARDVGRHTLPAPRPAVAVRATGGGVDWPSAAIGVVLFGGLVLVAFAVTTVRRRVHA